MATRTKPDARYTDDFGVERATADEPTAIDKIRKKAPVIDHLMRMQERFGQEGGNQYSAGITYFSVMAIFPLAMITFAALAFFLASRPDLLTEIQDQISGSLPGEMGAMVNTIIDQAIEQRGAVAGIGGLTALWSGLGWMTNLRAGVSAMWLIDPTEGGNIVVKKLKDLVALLGLLLAFFIAFAVTAIGSSGITEKILDLLSIESFPGMTQVIFVLGLVIGYLANFLVFAWMLMALPRLKVPRRSGLIAAAIGALIFEVIKQLSTLIFGALLGNPAGAVFGPVIGLMLVFYLIWRIVMYLSAWAATTEESLAATPTPAPEPAVIRVRNEVSTGADPKALLGIGAAVGAGVIALLSRNS
ncbi:YhjD/YihY/BrkB family envelope integrity protein [Corynebacterium uterequi]|uniref:Putative membrane protein n=1 Tax=Corynebacterium uterequi TaxID=1072256 RepID=A0A0G3HH37_9CORY|nr:YhjD/YihY/BrkB family envelope integrity protein [Corynebacterium uterequi]AKK10482.1 putative membrane protein [Corynebacterium uterequi]